MFCFICFLSLAYARAPLQAIAAFIFTMSKTPFWRNAQCSSFYLIAVAFFEISVVHSEHSRAAEQQQQLKSSDVESDMHFIRRMHTEASRSRATSFKCNKNKIHVFFASSSFFRCCFEYIRLISICSDHAYYFIFFLNRISFCFVFDFVVHFFIFVVVAVIFLHAVLILLCHFLGSFHQLTALWLFFMNNAINCDFQNESNNKQRRRHWQHLKPKSSWCTLSHDFVVWPSFFVCVVCECSH